MYNTKHQKLKIIVSWIFVAMCMLLIFYLSNQNAPESNASSKGVLSFVVNASIDVFNSELSITERNSIINNINSIARNYMHGIVFLMLGVSMINAMLQSKSKFKYKFKYNISIIGISVAVCFIYGIIDEFHQIFVPGRTFQISDLAMDFAGSIIGVAIFAIVNYFVTRGKYGSFKTTW